MESSVEDNTSRPNQGFIRVYSKTASAPTTHFSRTSEEIRRMGSHFDNIFEMSHGIKLNIISSLSSNELARSRDIATKLFMNGKFPKQLYPAIHHICSNILGNGMRKTDMSLVNERNVNLVLWLGRLCKMPAIEDARLPSDRLFLESTGFQSGKSRILYGCSLMTRGISKQSHNTETFEGIYFCPLGFLDELLEDLASYMGTCDNVVIKTESKSPKESIYEIYSPPASEDPTKQREKSLFINPYDDGLLRTVSSYEAPLKVPNPEPNYSGCKICGLKSRHAVGYVCVMKDPFQKERAQSRQCKRAAAGEAPRVERGPRHVYTSNPKYQGAHPSCPIVVQDHPSNDLSTIKLNMKIAAELVRAYENLKVIITDVDNPVRRIVDALHIQKDAVRLPHWLPVAMTKEDANELEDYLKRIRAIVDDSDSCFRSLRIAIGGTEKEQRRNRESLERNEQDVRMAEFDPETQAKAQGQNSMTDYEMFDATQSNTVNNLSHRSQALRAPPKITTKKTARKLRTGPFVLDEDEEHSAFTSSYDADHEGSTPERPRNELHDSNMFKQK